MLATGEGRELAEVAPWIAAAPPSPGDLTAGRVAPAGITHHSSGDQPGDQTPEIRQASRSLRVGALLSSRGRECGVQEAPRPWVRGWSLGVPGDRVRCHGPASPPRLARSRPHSPHPKRQSLPNGSDLSRLAPEVGRQCVTSPPASCSACLGLLFSPETLSAWAWELLAPAAAWA